VKGAALAGCLQSAIENQIDIQGYGGTSAGAIVALLANVGYSGTEIHELLASEIHPLQLLENEGADFKKAKMVGREASRIIKHGFGIRGIWEGAFWYFRNRGLVNKALKGFGLDDGTTLEKKILDLVKARVPKLKKNKDITFRDLHELDFKPLKIVASDIAGRRAEVFCLEKENGNQSVIKAIRASSSYPGLFKPVTSNDKLFVDGGLSSNLPAFLFAEEHERNQLPTITFDLVSQNNANLSSIFGFAGAMMDTALEASDEIIGSMIEGSLRVRVKIPINVTTLKFDLEAYEVESLFNAGKAASDTEFNRWSRLKLAQQAGAEIQKELQTFYGDPQLFTPLLWGLAQSIQNYSQAEGIRCHIMLPTGRANGSRIIVYNYGFRNSDHDHDLELNEFGGCSGRANKLKQPIFADLEKAEANFEDEWHMTDAQQKKVPDDRKSMLSVPIFANINENPDEQPNILKRTVRGVLSIDSITPIKDSGWLELDSNDKIEGVTKRVAQLAIQWSAIISKVLR